MTDFERESLNNQKTMIELLTEIKEALCKDCIPLTTKLLTEYLNHEDVDGNGLIYGKDFVFRNPPPALVAVKEQIIKDNPNIRQITMEEFKRG